MSLFSSFFAGVVLSFLCYRGGVGLIYEHSLSLRPFKSHDYLWGFIDNIRKRPQWDIYNVI